MRRYHGTRLPASVLALDRELFPHDDPLVPEDGDVYYVVWCDRKPVAYGGYQPHHADRAAYLHRYGVATSHRGMGLQRRLIRASVRHAKRAGFEMAYSYTSALNFASSRNFSLCGFSLWLPPVWHGRRIGKDEWVGVLHWCKRLAVDRVL